MNKYLLDFQKATNYSLEDNEESYILWKGEDIPSDEILDKIDDDEFLVSSVSTTDGQFSVSVIQFVVEPNDLIEVRVINMNDGSTETYVPQADNQFTIIK